MITIDSQELQILCNMVVELTRIKQKEVPHLCIENFASECLEKIIISYSNACCPILVIGEKEEPAPCN